MSLTRYRELGGIRRRSTLALLQLTAGQAAQVSELLEYFHLRTRQLVQGATVNDDANQVTMSAVQWQDLLDLQAQLAEYLRAIDDPGSKG